MKGNEGESGGMLDISPFTNASSESSFRNQEGKKMLAGRRRERRQRITKSNNKEGRNDKERGETQKKN